MKRKLYIPANVSIRTEVWKGLSLRDGLLVAALFVVGVVAALLLAASGLPLIPGMIGACILAGGAATLFQRLPSNLSILDYIKISIRFHRSQKRYRYVHRR